MKTLEELQKLRPTTLDGIRGLATQLKKAKGIQHAKALDEAARQVGYNGYQAAHRALKEQR